MAKMKKFLGPASSQRGQLSGKKKLFFDFDPFWPHSEPKREPALKSASKFGTFASFFDTFDFEAL